MRRKISLLLLLVILCFATLAHGADTLLVGYDTASYAGGCWIDNASTIDNYSWKASRYQVLASGTISYFKLRSPITPTGCTNDSGCWAIYEGGSSTVPGDLKAYNCFNGYNWTTDGLGDHSFPVVTTGTNLTVTEGEWYWIVFYSYGIDASHYSNAGCAAFIPSYRGQNDQACFDLANLQTSPYVSETEVINNVSTPPAGAAFNVGTATYVLWGVWASGEAADTTDPTVTAFVMPASAITLTVAISTFTATDNTEVTGYKCTESASAPGPGDAGWTFTAPSSYTFGSSGSKTLYAWAKDAAGNVSAALTDTVEISMTCQATAGAGAKVTAGAGATVTH